MTIATYSDLQTAVGDWLARSDLTARIPDFIMLAEAKFNRVLKCFQMEARVTTTVNLQTAEPEFITLPTDFQRMRSLRISSVTGKPRLQYLTDQQMDDYRTSIADLTGQPAFFTVFGTELELAPTPDQYYTLEMIYRQDIPALSVSNTSNWLLASAPDAYLYGALLEAAPYLKDAEHVGAWVQAFSAVIDQLNDQSQSAQFSAGPLAMYYTGTTP